jgi:hypothetical protein
MTIEQSAKVSREKEELMNWMQAFDDPLAAIEKSLRNLIHDELSARFGPEWHRLPEAGLGPEWTGLLDRKLLEDQTIQAGAAVYDLPIAYSEFRDLLSLLDKHQDVFNNVFADWTATRTLLDQAAKLRNTVKHHRDIGPTQIALLTGIAGEILDAVSCWYIGVRSSVVSTNVQFTKLVPTDDRSEGDIIAESSSVVVELASSIEKSLVNAGLVPSKLKREVKSDFEICTGTSQDLATIKTSSRANQTSKIDNRGYKSVTAFYTHRCGSQLDLARVLDALSLRYRQISYELQKPIDLPQLQETCGIRAGLSSCSSSKFNGELSSLEYSFLSGRIRIGIGNPRSKGRGEISANGGTEGFIMAHVHLPAGRLIGVLLGDISPKAIAHLVALST